MILYPQVPARAAIRIIDDAKERVGVVNDGQRWCLDGTLMTIKPDSGRHALCLHEDIIAFLTNIKGRYVVGYASHPRDKCRTVTIRFTDSIDDQNFETHFVRAAN